MAKGQKILIVDDSTFMRIIIKRVLAKHGYTDIIEAENGREGLDQVEKERPDLVVLDIIMPAMDGLLTLKKLMKIDKKPNVVMITAVGQEQIMKECDKLGVKGYITKPFKDKQILKIVKSIIGPGKGRKQKIM